MMFPETVEICLHEIKQAKARLIYLLGADDAGKTTLTKELANRLILAGNKVAIIDADPGQSNRLPLTLSLNYGDRRFDQFFELVLVDWAFIPGYDLMKWFQRYIKLMECWIEKARKEVSYCLIDSSGDTRRALKLREIELLKPDLVIALHRKAELEAILAELKYESLLFKVPQAIKKRSPKLRRERRNESFVRYFGPSRRREFALEPPNDWKNKIVGLYGRGRFLGLGIAKGKEADKLRVITPVQAKVDNIEFGSVMVDPEKGEIHEASL